MATVLNPPVLATTVTSATTVQAGYHTPVDATGGSVTVTLPTPSNPTLLTVEKVDTSTNTVVISGSIRGATSTITLNGQYEVREMLWTGSTWRPIGDHRTKAYLDATYAAYGSTGGGTVSDATTTTKGIVQLAGDLAGSAAAPTLKTLSGLSAGSYGSGTSVPIPTIDTKGRITAITTAPVSAPNFFSNLVSGNYYYTAGQTSTSTATLANGSLRAHPWVLPNDMTITRLGAEITTIGQTGAHIRLGIYNSDANGNPTTLAVDAGTVAADVVGVPELTISVALSAGIYWIASVAQDCATTAPTVRIPSASAWPFTAFVPIPNPLTSYTNETRMGFQHATTLTTGALPGTWSTSGYSLTHPRVWVKVS